MAFELFDKVKNMGSKFSGVASDHTVAPPDESAKGVELREKCIHPHDKIASEKLKSIPGFEAVMRRLMELGLDQGIHMQNMTSFIRLTESQMPNVFRATERICRILKITMPEIYLDLSTSMPVHGYGVSKTTIVVGPPLIAFLDDELVLVPVLAHECGHIFCCNCLYRTIMQFGKALIGNLMPKPIEMALDYWSRKSELSADRVAALVCGDAQTPIKAEMKLAGVGNGVSDCLADQINIEAWAAQMDEIEDPGRGNLQGTIVQNALALMNGHTISALRVREILNWVQSSEFPTLKAQIDSGDF